MKKTALYILMILASINTLYSQPFYYDTANYILTKLHYTNSQGEKGLTTFLYTPENKLYKAVWQQLNKKRHSENYYTIKNNTIINLYREFSDSVTITKTFTYNKFGKVKKESFKRDDGKTGVANYLYKNGQLQTIQCKGLNGWFYGEIRYEPSQNPSHADIFKQGQKVGTITYNYSKQGNLITEQWDFTGKWSQTFKYKYAPKKSVAWTNANPLLQIPDSIKIASEWYNYNDDLSGPSLYAYNVDGTLNEKIFTRSDTFRTVTNYHYDKNKRLIKSTRNYSNGKQATFQYHYNHFNQIIRKNYFHSDGIKGSETFLYDMNGRLIAARYDNMDKWLTGTIIFEHDLFDRIENGTFKSDKGYKAHISFQRNKAGFPETIKWEFSFGASQVYRLRYE